MNNIENKNIAIVGAGPGGLTLARLLQMNGADVKVYVKEIANKDARAKGATLDLGTRRGVTKALQEAGLTEAFMANYRPDADKLCITDRSGNIVFDDEADMRGEAVRPEIDRGPLQQILLDSLLPGTVIWGSHFESLSSQNNTWKLQFKNGDEAFADIVIAA